MIAMWKLACVALGSASWGILGAASPPSPEAGVVAFRSADGLGFKSPAIPVAVGLRQPDVLLIQRPTPSRNGPDAGTLLCFGLVAGDPGPDAGAGVRRALSTDQGRTWSALETIRIIGWPPEFREFQPAAASVVQLDDARLRLYFTLERRGGNAPPPPTKRPAGHRSLHGGDVPPTDAASPAMLQPRRPEAANQPMARVFSAVSNDGLQFAFEEGHRYELSGISDPDVVRVPDPKQGVPADGRLGPWLLFATRGDSMVLATSADGLTFTRHERFEMPSVRRGAAMPVATDPPTVRIYGVQTSDGAIVSGVFNPFTGELTPDPGQRLAPGSGEDRGGRPGRGGGGGGGMGGEPSAAPAGDGATLLVLAGRATDKPNEIAPSLPSPVPGRPIPKTPLDPRYPPTHPDPVPVSPTPPTSPSIPPQP